MLDRCVLIEMNAGQGVQLLPLAKRIAEEMKVDVSDIELLPTVMAANGSFRNLTHNVRRLIHRKAESTNIIF